MRTIAVIPAYNEERTVGEVVRSVRAHVPDVIVVDDGSEDATGERARHAGAMVVTHCVNRGLGAALGTGLAAALGHRVLRMGQRTPGVEEELATGKHPVSGTVHEETYSDVEERADIIVTLDADGQHDPAEIAALVAPVQAGLADLVIGVRFQSHRTSGDVPVTRRVFHVVANLVTRLLFNVRCSDTQSGFRVVSRRAAQRIEIRTNRMEVSSELLAEAARLGLRIAEVPVRTIYTGYSLSKGQNLAVGVRTAWALLLRRLF